MRELDELRHVTDLVRQPPLESLVTTARRRRRRAVATLAAAGAALALVVGGGAMLGDLTQRSAPAVNQPRPAPSSPEGIVTGAASRLVTAAVSPDDPDVRLSVWESDCRGCGSAEGAPGTRSALAVTGDGYASTTYVADPADRGTSTGVVGAVHGPRIDSPGQDLFLLVDTERPAEWLVHTDGTVQRVERVATRIAPSDSRLWFRCFPADEPAAWKGASPLDPTRMFPWCALDPDAATAYEWPARWDGSVTLPVSGAEPWGADVLWQPTFAWWESGGARHRRFLADGVGDARDVVWSPPTGGPLFFRHLGFDPTLDLVSPREGSGVDVVTREAPDTSPQFDLMAGTPGGALLSARTRWTGGAAPAGRFHETVVWRAEHLDSAFEVVHESPMAADLAPDQLAWVHEPTVVGGRILVMTPRGTIVSDDDGRTWTEITRWR